MDQAGIPIYPGATVKGDAHSNANPNELHFNELLSTPDSADRVVAFYGKALQFKPKEQEGVIHMDGRTSAGADILMSIQPDGPTTKITIQGIVYKNAKPQG